ncbi:hypothetical protein JHK85_013539 [Glycine max]|nr:hypothetical protein JHK85_013539 [Glycine max]
MLTIKISPTKGQYLINHFNLHFTCIMRHPNATYHTPPTVLYKARMKQKWDIQSRYY